jgi:hypothetical protein
VNTFKKNLRVPFIIIVKVYPRFKELIEGRVSDIVEGPYFSQTRITDTPDSNILINSNFCFKLKFVFSFSVYGVLIKNICNTEQTKHNTNFIYD